MRAMGKQAPSKAQRRHAQKITHRDSGGKFLSPLEKRAGKGGATGPSVPKLKWGEPDPNAGADKQQQTINRERGL